MSNRPGDIVLVDKHGLCGVLKLTKQGLVLAPLEGQDPPPPTPQSAVQRTIDPQRVRPGHRWVVDQLLRRLRRA